AGVGAGQGRGARRRGVQHQRISEARTEDQRMSETAIGQPDARTRRLIVCYDIKAGRVVKGTSFVDLTDQGDPADLVAGPAAAGADELALLDIVGAPEGRPAFLDIVRRACAASDVPVCVGGGIRSLDDVERALE